MYTKPDDFILSDDMITADESFSDFFRDAILQFGIGFCFLVIIVQSVCFKDKGNCNRFNSSEQFSTRLRFLPVVYLPRNIRIYF